MFNTLHLGRNDNLAPHVQLDDWDAGQKTVAWLYENYKQYWGDIDTSEIAFIDLTYSVNIDLQKRCDAAVAKFKEYFPNNDMFFTGDGIIGSVNVETGYEITSAIMSVHPDIKYWWVMSCLEQYSQGAARVAETLGIEDRVLIVDVGSDILVSEWDSGYNGSWKACLAISNYLYAAPAICAIVSMADGMSTPETLWGSMRIPGETMSRHFTESTMVTIDTYRSYFEDIARIAMPA